MNNPQDNSPVTNVLLFLIMTSIFVAGLMVTCSCDSALNADKVFERVIYDEWKIAQAQLECLGYSVRNIGPERFRWSKHKGPFKCGNVLRANGCFYTGTRMISWNSETPTVIRHEAGHALLWLSNEAIWRCYEHSEKKNCPSELTNPCPQGVKQ